METPIDLLKIFEERMAEMGMSQSQLEAKAFGKAGNAAIQNLKRGADPAFGRVAAMARALGLELYLGVPRPMGMAEPQADNDFHSGNIARAGYLPLPWAEPGPGKGSAPLAIHSAWLDRQALVPDGLSAIIPDVSMVEDVEPTRTVCVIEKDAPRRGAGHLWCLREAGKVILARLAWTDGGFVLMPPRLNEAPRVCRLGDPNAPHPIGQVAFLAVVTTD